MHSFSSLSFSPSFLHKRITNSSVWCFSYSSTILPFILLPISCHSSFLLTHLHPPSTIMLLIPHLHPPLHHKSSLQLSLIPLPAFVSFCYSNTCHVFPDSPLYSRSTLHPSSISSSATKAPSSPVAFLPSFAIVSCFQVPVTHLTDTTVSFSSPCVHSLPFNHCPPCSSHLLLHSVHPCIQSCTQEIFLPNCS